MKVLKKIERRRKWGEGGSAICVFFFQDVICGEYSVENEDHISEHSWGGGELM